MNCGSTSVSTPAPLQLGGLRLASRYLLSPLAGYTNLPFRLAVRELGGLGLATLCGGIGEGECVIVRVDA